MAPKKELQLASMEVIRWPSKNGFEIEGLFHLPAGYTSGTQIPLMLNIHGGPAGCFVNSFRKRLNSLYKPAKHLRRWVS